MKMLSKACRHEMFRKGAAYAVRANKSHRQLCDLVADDMGREVVWRRSERLDTPKAVIGGAHDPDKSKRVLIVTAPCHRDPGMVSFVLAHEIAHFALRHYEQGSFILGYTRREAEADAFSFAFLYGTAQSCTPCGGTLAYNAIYTAIRRVYDDEPDFRWPEDIRIDDIKTVKGLVAGQAAAIKP
jgi:hypothetical protein